MGKSEGMASAGADVREGVEARLLLPDPAGGANAGTGLGAVAQ